VSAFCDRGSEVGRIIDETRAGEGGGGGSGRGRTLCARAAEALAAAEMEEAMARAKRRTPCAGGRQVDQAHGCCSAEVGEHCDGRMWCGRQPSPDMFKL
jgi:hypothetical protein